MFAYLYQLMACTKQVGYLGLASWLLILPAAFRVCDTFLDTSIAPREGLFFPLQVGVYRPLEP